MSDFGRLRDLEDFAHRLSVAQEYAQWELGSSYWADKILQAFANPEQAQKKLEQEKG